MVHNMKEITSVNNEYIKNICKLKDKKNRNLEKKFLIEGYHLVDEAYEANCLQELFVLEYQSKYSNITQVKVNDKIMEKLSFTKSPQGIVGVCSMNSNKEIKGSKFLLLDNINDPGNLGTLIRSSIGFDIDTIILSEDCVDLYNDKTIRSTQGGIFNINIVVSNLEETIEILKRKKIKVIGTSLDSAVDLKTLKPLNQYALLLGNEANGVKNKLLEKTDINVKIEMNKKLESLNVAVAGSIIMYYINK